MDFLFLSCAFIDSETAQSELLCCKTMWSDFFKEEEEKEKICISVRISIYLFNDVILASSSYDLQLGLELFASIRISDSKSETLSLCLSVRKKQCPLLVGNELLHGRLWTLWNDYVSWEHLGEPQS